MIWGKIMEYQKSNKEWIGTLGGFIALLAMFLPFEPHRSLFEILENDPIPFFSPLIVLLMVLALVLQDRDLLLASLLSMSLLLGWLFLFSLLLWAYTPAVLKEMGPGAFLLPLGLLGMLFGPYAA